MAHVGGAGETPKQQPAKKLEVNNEQRKTQEAQQNQKTVAQNCVWQKEKMSEEYSRISIWKNDKLTEEYLVSGGIVDASQKYSYDEKGNLVLIEFDHDNDGTTDEEKTFTYDHLNRVKTRTSTEFGLSRSVVECEYEGEDTRPSKITITTDYEDPQRPDTKDVFEYMYNEQEILEKVDLNGDGTVDEFLYNNPPPQICPANVKKRPSGPEPKE